MSTPPPSSPRVPGHKIALIAGSIALFSFFISWISFTFIGFSGMTVMRVALGGNLIFDLPIEEVLRAYKTEGLFMALFPLGAILGIIGGLSRKAGFTLIGSLLAIAGLVAGGLLIQGLSANEDFQSSDFSFGFRIFRIGGGYYLSVLTTLLLIFATLRQFKRPVTSTSTSDPAPSEPSTGI